MPRPWVSVAAFAITLVGAQPGPAAACEGDSCDADSEEFSVLQASGRRAELRRVQRSADGAGLHSPPADASEAMSGEEQEFQKFLSQYPREYHTKGDKAEYGHRLRIFKETLAKAKDRNEHEKKHNPHPQRAEHGVTQYADWTDSEFMAILGYKGKKFGPVAGTVPESPAKAVEPSLAQGSSGDSAASSRLRDGSAADAEWWPFNWPTMPKQEAPPAQPACTKSWTSHSQVRNQGLCGDCWTFATAELLRAVYFEEHGIDTGKLSTQYIVDCMKQTTCRDGVNGCCGGNAADAMKWISQQGGIPTAADYGDVYSSSAYSLAQASGGPVSTSHGITYSGNNPHQAFACKQNIPKAITVGWPKWHYSEKNMMEHVCSTGPLSIAVDASHWKTYKKGIIHSTSCGTSTNHAVNIVGINATANAWIVQNSWGEDFGVSKDGQDAVKDQYGNCAQLAGPERYGCRQMISATRTVADGCPKSCSPPGANIITGGYAYLQFGANTCGLAQQAYSATSTAPAK